MGHQPGDLGAALAAGVPEVAQQHAAFAPVTHCHRRRVFSAPFLRLPADYYAHTSFDKALTAPHLAKLLKCTKPRKLYNMQTVALSEFRANASAIVDLVEAGETVRILRHGKPVADLVPARVADLQPRLPNWKRPFEPVQLVAGVSLSQAVLDERQESPW